MKKIKPTILKGTRDFLPLEMAKRSFVMRAIQGIFERFGYVAIETPILSPAETILGKYGEEGDRLTYTWKDRGERDVALPYDLTVPFARYAASNWTELPMPFKRYQIQRVWRAEKPQKGRLREFYQCDIDVVGTRSLLVEAEVAKVIVEVFAALDIGDVIIKVNSRRLMNAVLGKFGVTEKSKEVIRTIDKLDKSGPKEVGRELNELGVAEPEKLMALLSPAESMEKTLAKFEAFDMTDLDELFRYTDLLGIGRDRFQFDPSLARGLDYYTGIIYEVVAGDSGLGSICGGGRYDDLTGLFEIQAPDSAVTEVSGMGVAFGFERIMLLMEERGLLASVKLSSDVLVTVFDKLETPNAVELYRDLIRAGLNAEIYFEAAKLDKQLKYADKKGIRFTLIAGPAETKEGEVIVKDMEKGTQETVKRSAAASYLQSIL